MAGRQTQTLKNILPGRPDRTKIASRLRRKELPFSSDVDDTAGVINDNSATAFKNLYREYLLERLNEVWDPLLSVVTIWPSEYDH